MRFRYADKRRALAGALAGCAGWSDGYSAEEMSLRENLESAVAAYRRSIVAGGAKVVTMLGG